MAKFQPSVQTLRCFVMVGRERSISKAVAKLHLSQSAVSLQLKNLEQMLGFTLLHRTPQGLVLTGSGQALLGHAEAFLDAAETFSSAAASLGGTIEQVLRIGTILDSDFIQLGGLLNGLAELAPGLRIELRHGMSDDALARVARRELDVGFYLDSPENAAPIGPATLDATGKAQHFHVLPLKRFVYRVAAPAGWEQQVLGKDWRCLAQLPWLSTPAASAHRRLLKGVFDPLEIDPRRSAAVDKEDSALDMLIAGAGLSLVREDVAQRESKLRQFVIADKVKLECVLSFMCLESRRSEPPIAAAWEALERAWRSST